MRSAYPAQVAARSIRAAAGEGNGRTGESLEPSLMPRKAEPRFDGWLWRGARTGRCEAADAGRRATPGRMSTVVLGVEGTHPDRSSCVRNAVTPSGSGPWAGKPTVRRAQPPGGNRMTEKRTPVAERQRETATGSSSPLRLVVADNRLDTGPRGPA